MTELVYNGISLGMILTKGLEQQTVYDQSGTDMLYVKFRISVQCIFTVLDSGQTLPFGSMDPSDGPSDVMKQLRHHLLVPRRPFYFAPGGKELLSVPGGLDAANGPKPIRCDVIKVTEKTFRVEYEIEVCTADCDGNYQMFSSNRWTQRNNYNEKGFLKITTIGRLETRSDMQVNPSQMRGLCAPPLYRNFKREVSQYELSADALSLTYHFEDLQMYLLPPEGCVGADSRISTVSSTNGATWIIQLDQVLEGGPSMPKARLRDLSVMMAMQSMDAFQQSNGIPKKAFIQYASFTDHLFESKMHVSIRAMFNTKQTVHGSSGRIPSGAQIGAIAGRAVAKAYKNQGAIGFGGAAFGKALVEVWNNQGSKESQKANVDNQNNIASQQPAATEFSASVQVPPYELLGAPVPFSPKDAPGLDPKLLNNLDFVDMVAAEFNDPCMYEAIGRLTKKTPPFVVPENSVPQGQSAMANPGLSSGNVSASLSSGNWLGSLVSTIVEAAGKSIAELSIGSYTYWHCAITYKTDSGRFVLPSTIKGMANRAVNLFNPTTDILVTWSAQMLAEMPEVPAIIDPNIEHLVSELTEEEINLAGDGVTLIYTLSGQSKYSVLDNSKMALRSPVPPWIESSMEFTPVPYTYLLNVSTSADSFINSRLPVGDSGVNS